MRDATVTQGTPETYANSDLRQAMARIREGDDPESALTLIRYFHYRLSRHEDFEQDLLHDYLRWAFGRIVDSGLDAALAFGLRESSAATESDQFSLQDQGVALTIEYLRRFDPYRGAHKRGTLIAAERFGLSRRQSEEIHARCQNWLATLSDETLKRRLEEFNEHPGQGAQ